MSTSVAKARELKELGFEAVWMEDVEEGDEVSIPSIWDADPIVIVKVTKLRQSPPQFERDGGSWSFTDGKVLNPDNPHYVYSFVGVHEDDTETHHSFGKGYGVYRRRRDA